MSRKPPKSSRTFADAMRDSAADSDEGMVWRGGILGTPEERAREFSTEEPLPPTERDYRYLVTTTLDQLGKDADYGGSGLVIVIIAPWLVLLHLDHLGTYEQEIIDSFLRISIAITAAVLLAIIVMIIRQHFYRGSLWRMIREHPDQAQLIPGCGKDFGAIVDYVPGPFHSTFPKEDKALNLDEQAKLVAKNLDWYLGEPRPLFRVIWISRLLSLLAFALASAYHYHFGPPNLFNEEIERMIIASALAYSWIWYFLVKSSIGTLAKHLEAVRVEVYREFVGDWYKANPPSEEDA